MQTAVRPRSRYLGGTNYRLMSTSLPAAVGGFGYRMDKSIQRLRYVEDVSIAAGASGASVAAIYGADDCYDPRVATGGHQPIGFDQYMLFYDHFRVISSKITVTYIVPTTYAAVVGIQLRDDDTPVTNSERNREMGNIVYRTIYGDTGSAANMTTLSYSFDAKKFYGPTYLDATHKGNGGASPSERAYYHVLNMSPDYSTSADINCNITIDYVVEFTERKPLTQS